MDLKNFSLLYPDLESSKAHAAGIAVPNIDTFELEELGIAEIFSLQGRELCEFLTVDPDVMKYRIETFSDMLENPEIAKTMNKLVPILNDIMELRRLDLDGGDTNAYLSSITEIELYISSVDTLYAGFDAVRGKLKGKAFTALSDYVFSLAKSDYYVQLNEKLRELTGRVREIKSVTIGVNLDAQLRPAEAGVLSINSRPFKSGDVIEKILRMNFKDDEYTCIAQLVPFGKKQSENEKAALSLAFSSAIGDVYKSSLRSWKKIVQSYVLENTEFLLNLMPEFEFFVKGTELLSKLRERGCALCVPSFAPAQDRAYSATGLYNPCVAVKSEGEIITNDLSFDENATVYVLTGPNRGGKSVITCALGISQVMAQLGMFVAADEITLSPVDAIFTHFPTGADDTIDKGRLGEECDRLRDVFESVTPESLILMDESFSSTGAYEASYIAAEVLRAISYMGCRCIFSTHLHQLAAEIDTINAEAEENGYAKIDTLVAGIETGRRSFKIYRQKPDGKSYARDIALKYGISYENIINGFNERK